MLDSSIQAIAATAYQNFLTAIKGANLTPDESALTQRVLARLAQYGITAIGATPEQASMLKMLTNLELATLANLAVAKEIAVEQAARQAVMDAVTSALSIGLKLVLGAAAAL